jgi:hypothetical protein
MYTREMNLKKHSGAEGYVLMQIVGSQQCFFDTVVCNLYNRKIVPLSEPVKLVTAQLDNIFRGKSLWYIFPTKEINIIFEN